MSSGIRTTTHTVVNQANIRGLPDLYRILAARGVRACSFSQVLESGRGQSSTNSPLNEFIKALVELKSIELDTGGPPVNLSNSKGYLLNAIEFRDLARTISQKPDVDPFLLHCTGARSKIEIDADGSLYPCFLLRFPEFLGGNVLDGHILEVWGSDVWNDVRAVTRNAKRVCAVCDMDWCNTGCMGLSYAAGHGLLAPDPQCRYLGQGG